MVALNYVKDHVQRNQYSRPGDRLLRVQAIVVHYTANPGANALMHANYFDGSDGGGGRYAGAHIFVDRKEAREIIPLNEVAYHANERRSGPLLSALKATASYYPGGNANLLTLGIEMCLEADGSFHPDTVARTQAVIRKLQAQFPQLKDTRNRVVRHYDVTGKLCPLPYVKESAWQAFLAGVDRPSKSPVVKPATPAPPKKTPAQIAAEKEATQMTQNMKDTGFSDVNKNAYYADAVKFAKEAGVLDGFPDGTFKPNEPLTRGQAAVLVERLLKRK